jgi:hypothetical protein
VTQSAVATPRYDACSNIRFICGPSVRALQPTIQVKCGADHIPSWSRKLAPAVFRLREGIAAAEGKVYFEEASQLALAANNMRANALIHACTVALNVCSALGLTVPPSLLATADEVIE